MLQRFRAKIEERYVARLAAALRGRRIVVTGASSGIGRAFALQAARAGADLVIVARRRDELEQVAAACAQLGGRAQVRAADLSDVDASRALADVVQRDDGPVDVLVNNAGHSLRRAALEHAPEDLRRLVEVNYLGPMALTLGLLPGMLARGAGHIVQVSTIGVQTGAPNFAAYAAAKAAADEFARTLRLELGGRGIDVTTIHMPLVRTAMLAPTRIYDAFPALDAERAARRIGWAIVQRPVRVAPRWTTALDVAHALAPGLVQWVFRHGHEPFHRAMARRLERSSRRR
ncbi:MAG: short-chain dehydrogenase [Proteobacteria bacterium]|nr:MAG: short-chain dehydrogenase [Pseudomonadota bacterium]